MAKLSLLDIVQDIANDLETDQINSINDTVESVQIAQIVKTVYFEMMANRNWPHLKSTFQLDASGTINKPTHLKLPEGIKEVVLFTYNKRKSTDTRDKYQSVKWLENEQFLDMLNMRNSSATNVSAKTDFGGISLNLFNDRAPEYYTSFDDEYIVCDAHDSIIDSTLQTSKTQCIGYISPSWTTSDTFVPDLPEDAFPALIEESKSTAFIVIKQTANEKAEQKSQRQQRWLSRKAWRVDGGIRYPSYGRKNTKGAYSKSHMLDKNN